MLASPQWREGLNSLRSCPREALHGLFASLYSTDLLVRWHAVTGFGVVVPALAEHSLEDARIVMRRLLWSVNEESGGIGWGAPEAMAEIMACHAGLAREFASILRSYIHEAHARDDNYLELPSLRRGAVWGLGRLAEADPSLAAPAAEDLRLCLADADGPVRGLACRALGLIGVGASSDALSSLLEDSSEFELYAGDKLIQTTVSEQARHAMERLNASG
jgi:HEAT repeat protein